MNFSENEVQSFIRREDSERKKEWRLVIDKICIMKQLVTQLSYSVIHLCFQPSEIRIYPSLLKTRKIYTKRYTQNDYI